MTLLIVLRIGMLSRVAASKFIGVIIASEVVQSSAYVFSGTGRIFQRSTMRWLRIMDCNY